jgi:CDGSH-type Zn-finger protein
MAMAEDEQKITVRPHGPYMVRGKIPLARKSQVETEYGEPYDWKTEQVLETTETYRLCRCGQSKSKPFCDSSHTLTAFDGGETADIGDISSREKVFEGEEIVSRTTTPSVCTLGIAGPG